MANEIELKLALPMAAQRLLLRQPILRKAVARQSQQLVNLYYDTPTLALHRHAIALRLRKQGRLWLQTVKCAGSSAAGLTTRPEWETPYAGHFDFSTVDAKAVRGWLERQSDRIAPLFETNFRRTTWRFEPRPGCVVLLMLDRGWIAAGGRREAISEVEIELAGGKEHENHYGDGNVNELFKLAQILAERLALVPAILSKAERGYRLFQDARLTPQKGRLVPLASTSTPLAAFRQIVLAGLEHLQGNLDGAIYSDDPEFIRQLRAATRRLRAALRLFAPRLPSSLAAELLPELRILTARLDHARDLDVLQSEIASPVMHALPGEPRLALLAGAVTDQQYSARGAAVHHLQSIAYGRWLLQATALLHRPPFTAALEPALAAEETLAEFASVRLKRLHRKVLALAGTASEDPLTLQPLRIGIRRLRYALEFFSPLAAAKPLRRMLKQLTVLQDELGQLSDLENAGPLLMHCAGDDQRLREAVSLVGGWHASRYSELLACVSGRVKRLVRLKLPRLA